MKINVKNLMMFLFIFLFVPIEITMNLYHYSFYIKALFSIIFFFIFLFSKPTSKQLFICCIFFIFNFAMCIPDFIDKSASFQLFFSKFYPFGLYCGITYYLNNNFDKYIYQMRNVSIFVSFLFVLCLIYNILSSRSITPILYFNRNGMQFYLLFNIGSILLWRTARRIEISRIDFVSLFISILGLFISGSATSAIIGLFIIVYLVFGFKKINLFNCYILYLIIWFFLILGQNSDNFLLSFIFRIFKKNSTFSNRLWRWQYSIEFIKYNWLWGTPNLMQIVKEKNIFFSNEIFNSHNGILDVFVHGGIFSIISLIILFLKAAYNDVKYIGTRYYRYIVMIIISFLICSYTESSFSNNVIVFYNFILISIFYNGEVRGNKMKEVIS